MPSTAIQGDLRRRSELFTRRTNAPWMDGSQLQRRVQNQAPDSATRNYVLNSLRDKERVTTESVQRGRRPLRDDLKVTTRTDTWHPRAGAVLIQRVPGKTGRLLDRGQTLTGARRGR